MRKIFLVALPVFVVLQALGFTLANHRPLWTDELHTQTASLPRSYSDIIQGKLRSEGNRAPLFYLQQKLWCDLFGYRTPAPWMEGRLDHVDPYANMFLRILPVTWMSLFFLLVFVYFSVRFNLATGFFGLGLALSFHVLWLYWSEARPYGLWILLTGMQMVLFLEVLRDKTSSRKWAWLCAVHILLALNCVLSVFQIAAVSLALACVERRWTKYALLTALPLLLAFCYKPRTPAQDAIFLMTVGQMMDIVCSHRALGFLLYPAALGLYFLQSKKILPPIFKSNALVQAFPFFLAVIVMGCATALFLQQLYARATGEGQYVVVRHIVFLSPVVIIGITYLTALLWQNLDVRRPFKIGLLAAMAGLLLYRINDAWWHIYYLFVGNPYT